MSLGGAEGFAPAESHAFGEALIGMTVDELCRRLGAREVVVMPLATWQALELAFALIEEQETFQSGLIGIRRGECGLVTVEQSKHEERVVRGFADLDAARAFVNARLATYERMWNGCGCRIDYYR